MKKGWIEVSYDESNLGILVNFSNKLLQNVHLSLNSNINSVAII